MKQLSSRWAVLILLVPVVLVISILMAGWGTSPLASSNGGKGYVQVAFTGAVSGQQVGNPFPNYQSVLLNVIAVRFNPSKNMSLSDSDSGWATVAVAPGATAGDAFGSLSFGGSFGPNGNAVNFGTARSEMQVDLSLLQNNLTVFNTSKVSAQVYYQVELLLDGGSPATLVPLCGSGQSVGEGCITYPTAFPSGFTSIRYPAYGSPSAKQGILTVTRNSTTLMPIAINALPGAAPVGSTDPIQFVAEVCPIIALTGQTGSPDCTFSPGNTPPPTAAYAVGAVLKGKVQGATSKGVVEAEISGTGTVVSTATVDNSSDRNYFMMLPAGTYDLIASSPAKRTFDVRSHVVLTNDNGGEYVMDFDVKSASTRSIKGSVVDTCSGVGIPGAEVDLYGPPNWVDNIPCSPQPSPSVGATPFPTPPPQCNAQCDQFAPSGAPQDGCVVLATTSTNNTGSYPFTTSGSAPSAFNALPVLKDKKSSGPTGYSMKAIASGYNGRLMGMRTFNGSTRCDGSGFKSDECSFALQHGTLMASVDAGSTVTGSPLNVLVNVEDHGSFVGEGLQLTTIPVGKSSPAPFPISVPLDEPSPSITPMPTATPSPLPTKATPTATGTPVDIGGAPSYDMFASVQDLFAATPQKFGGHTYAVVSDVRPPPQACATVTPDRVLRGLTCVGHSSIQGGLDTVDQDTLISVAKLSPTGDLVQVSQSRVPQLTSPQSFSICEPVDSYIVTHYEAQPTGSPSPVSVARADLSGPVTITSAAGTTCHGICDAAGVPTVTPSGSPSATPTATSSPKQCLLCQGSAPLGNMP